jgi:hypothetical protein
MSAENLPNAFLSVKKAMFGVDMLPGKGFYTGKND